MDAKKKLEKINKFMYQLDEFVSSKVADAMADCHDSYTGMGAWNADEKMREALYELFEIKTEEDDN